MIFKIGCYCDYVQGHLRYGHKETEVEVNSREELEEMLKDPDKCEELFEDSDLVVDDYEVDEYSCCYNDCYIIDEEGITDNYNYEYGIQLLQEIRSRLDGPEPSDTRSAIDKAIELFKERIGK